MYSSSGFNGILQGGSGYDPELGPYIYAGYMYESGIAITKTMLTPEQNKELSNLYYQYIGATDFKTKQSLMWDIQSLLFDEFCVAPNILADIPLAAKYVKVHGEYTCYLSPYTWTFADAWMEK